MIVQEEGEWMMNDGEFSFQGWFIPVRGNRSIWQKVPTLVTYLMNGPAWQLQHWPPEMDTAAALPLNIRLLSVIQEPMNEE